MTQRNLVVLAALAIAIVGAICFAFRYYEASMNQKAAEAALLTDLGVIRDALDHRFNDAGCYPPSLSTLVDEGYLRRIPEDPITQSSLTWEVQRSSLLGQVRREEYPCDDSGVANVFSGSQLTGSNQVPYGSW